MTFDKDFKEAISHLPSSEKDKLILRLLKKDLVLANRLYFEPNGQWRVAHGKNENEVIT